MSIGNDTRDSGGDPANRPPDHPEDSSLFATQSLPVPVIPARRRDHSRRLLTWIAVWVLGIGAVSGVIYLQLWTRAGADLARLLPDSAWVYASTPPPLEAMSRVLPLDRWRDAKALAAGVQHAGYWASEPEGELTGLPLSLVRRIIGSTDSFQLALVPGPAGVTVLVFVEIGDRAARKRVTSRLSELLQPVDRHSGFRVDRIRSSPWRRFVGQDRETPRVVEMDPYLVFAWGPTDGLEDLLEARVGGRSDGIRQRTGFTAHGYGQDASGLRALVDPGAVWKLLAPVSERAETGLLVDGLSAVTLRARVGDFDEVVHLETRVRDDTTGKRLGEVARVTSHTLVDRAPSDADFVLSLATDSPVTTLSALRDLFVRAARDLDLDLALSELTTRLSTIELEAIVRLDWDVAEAFAGELVWVGMPGADPRRRDLSAWVLLGELEQPAVVEQALSRLLPFILGDRYAYGSVHDPRGTLHLVRPSEPTGQGTPDEILAWRIVDGILELSPRVQLLGAVREAMTRGRTLGDSGIAARARRELANESRFLALAHPRVLAGPDGALTSLLAAELSPDFRLALSVSIDGPWVSFESNVGPWTAGLPLLAADKKTIDDVTLAELDADCRQALDAMCALYPRAVPCQPFHLGRGDRVREACGRLYE